MTTVSNRAKTFNQPYGGFLRQTSFRKIFLNDGATLNETENLSPIVVGMAVDYLTRFRLGTPKEEAFASSLRGAKTAEEIHGREGYREAAEKLLEGVTGLDDRSIENACKLSTFDVWYRNPGDAPYAKTFKETNPDKATVENIHVMVERTELFLATHGPIVATNFTFEPPSMGGRIMQTKALALYADGKGTFGGYTSTVETGEGDYLTKTSMWDLKVSKKGLDSKQTLQLLMYWIMGLHSGAVVYHRVKTIGIYNPRLNVIYSKDVSEIPEDVVEAVEKYVIGYGDGGKRLETNELPQGFVLKSAEGTIVHSAPKRVRQFDKSMNLIAEYESLTAAADAVGCGRKGIGDTAAGKQKSCAGFIWRFV